MNAFTKVSDKGQVVVPKAVRDRLGWVSGTDLEEVETEDAVTFRRRTQRRSLTPDEAVAVFRSLYKHEGPPVGLEQMREDAQDEACRRWRDR